MSVALKHELKTITRQIIGTAASSIFLERCLAIIHESDEDTESLMTAAEKVSKRLALFIDQSLAQKVFAALKTKIDPVTSSPSVRKHKRFDVSKKVCVTYDGSSLELCLQNISLGGMYIKTDNPLPRGSAIDISLTVDNGRTLSLAGTVVFSKDSRGDKSECSPGMGIQLKVMQDNVLKLFKDYLDRVSMENRGESEK